MIYAFTGKTGSGKTFRMVHYAYKQWLKGANIYSNTVLLFDGIGGKGGYDITKNPEKFTLFEKFAYSLRSNTSKVLKRACRARKRGRIQHFENISEILTAKNAIILFDEAQVLFNAHYWEKLPPEFQYKLQQHRKHNLHLFCTTQNMATIDISYRRLVQYWFYYRERFAFLGFRNPSLFTVHTEEMKDIDSLYNQVDDLKVPTVHIKTFFIHKFKKRLYDTMYDVGFRRFKTLWVSSYSPTEKSTTSRWLIIPKEMSLQAGLRASMSLESASLPHKSRGSRKT